MPQVTKNIIIINLLMFLGKVVAERHGVDLDNMLGLHFILADDFRPYQFVTYMFLHGNLEHIFFNMFAVWMFGRIMEQVMGPRRFLFYYMVCGIGAGLIQEIAQYIQYSQLPMEAYPAGVRIEGAVISWKALLNQWNTIGASGAVYGVLLSFGMTFPEERMFIFPLPFPIKAKWFVCGYAVIELVSELSRRGDNVAHMAHLGGMLFGLALILYWRHQSGGNSGRFFGGGGSSLGGFDNNFYTRYEDVTNTSYSKQGPSLKQRLANFWQKTKKRFTRRRRPDIGVQAGGKHSSDMEWNYRKKEREAEIDRILEKVKKGGYNSLTDDEKRKLFDASGR